MLVLTDNIGYGEGFLHRKPNWRRVARGQLPGPITELGSKLFSCDAVYTTEMASSDLWGYLLLVEHAEESQFDVLADLSSTVPELPSGILCCAGSGENFHGFKGRAWAAVPGNLHLSVLLRPCQEIEGGGVAFIVLAVVSVLEALDYLDVLTEPAVVKWVNDILVGGSKLGGVLAQVQTQAETVTSAVLGIGLNIETTPQVLPTPFVPKVAALCDFAKDSKRCSPREVLEILEHRLAANYKKLGANGVSSLLEVYRRRSIVIGKNVTIYEDLLENRSREIVRGRVQSIGDGLELVIEGVECPVFRGRLALRASGGATITSHLGPRDRIVG
jgi:BirA family biotin operon repressor/biotin-[acetyl-CoA-carboxylase] ligase